MLFYELHPTRTEPVHNIPNSKPQNQYRRILWWRVWWNVAKRFKRINMVISIFLTGKAICYSSKGWTSPITETGWFIFSQLLLFMLWEVMIGSSRNWKHLLSFSCNWSLLCFWLIKRFLIYSLNYNSSKINFILLSSGRDKSCVGINVTDSRRHFFLVNIHVNQCTWVLKHYLIHSWQFHTFQFLAAFFFILDLEKILKI